MQIDGVSLTRNKLYSCSFAGMQQEKELSHERNDHMNFSEFELLTDAILENPNVSSPYDDPMYLDYTKLNRSRMKRWMKTLVLEDDTISYLQHLQTPQHWIIIVEPWCGDVAHVLPVLVKIAEANNFITYELQLRDQPPFLIESYLTNSSRSIPKLIARDINGNDLFTWGPRPGGAQLLMDRLKKEGADFETVKLELQNWYNNDKAIHTQKEIIQLLQQNESLNKSSHAA